MNMPSKRKAKPKVKAKKASKKKKLGSSITGSVFDSESKKYRFDSYLPSKKEELLTLLEELIEEMSEDIGDLNISMLLDLVRLGQWDLLKRMARESKNTVTAHTDRLDKSASKVYNAVKATVDATNLEG